MKRYIKLSIIPLSILTLVLNALFWAQFSDSVALIGSFACGMVIGFIAVTMYLCID